MPLSSASFRPCIKGVDAAQVSALSAATQVNDCEHLCAHQGVGLRGILVRDEELTRRMGQHRVQFRLQRGRSLWTWVYSLLHRARSHCG